jgi:UDP-N-acetyl-D-mannosaminuronate dehydrogenase
MRLLILIINEPDISYVKSVAEIVGKYLKKGAIAVLESTVYSGITEKVQHRSWKRSPG